MSKGLRRLGWILVGLYAAYLLAANLFLNAGFGPGQINRKPERFRMEWARGLSLYPGHVVLWQAQFHGHARRIRWSAQADRLSGRIALLPLLRRELQVPSAWAEQVRGSFAAAHELAPAEPRPGGWVLRFDRIATETLRGVRWDDYELDVAGAGKAEFGLWKQLRGGALEVFPSRAQLQQARVRRGDVEWLQQAALEVAFSLPRHTREQAAGWRRLALATMGLQLDGALPAFSVHMDEEPRWRGAVRNAGGGRVQAQLVLHQGQLQHGGRMELLLPLQASDAAGRHWTQQARLDLHVSDTIDLKLDMPPPPAGSGRVAAELRIAGRELIPHDTAPPLLPRLSGLVDLQWRFDSLAWLGPVLAKAQWLQLEGAGEVNAHVLVEAGRIAAGSRLSIPDVAVQADVQGQRFTGRARADGRVDSENGELRPRVDIGIQQFQVASAQTPQQAMVRGRDLKLELRSTGRVIEFRDSLRARLLFERAEVPDLRALNAFLPGHALRFLGGRGQLGGDLQLDAVGKVGTGKLAIQARQAQLAVNDLEFAGNVAVDAKVSRVDLVRDEFVLDGSTLALRKVKVSDPERAMAGDWWADIRFDRGRLQWGTPLRIDADASVRMSDISLLLALYSRHRDFPRWVPRLLDRGEVTASARAAVRDGAVTLEDVEVSNSRFDVKARLRLAQRRAEGDLFLRWAKLGLGLELKQSERKFHLLKAAEWFERQPRLLPASR